MNDLYNKANNTVKMILVVLLIGGIWGILEATLGTMLHLSSFENLGMYTGSSVVMVSIAYCLLPIAYKKTSKARSIMYCGFVAASIKLLLLCLPFFWTRTQSVINPAISIVLEAMCFAGIVWAIKPDKILSAKTFLCIFVASIAWRLAFVGLQGLEMSLFGMTSKSFYLQNGALVFDLSYAEKFIFMFGGLSCVYSAIIGAIAFGVNAILVKSNVKINTPKLDNIVFNPIFVSAIMLVSIGLTFALGTI